VTQYAIEDEMAACWLAGSFNPCNGTSCAPAAPLEGGAIEIHRIGQDLDCIGLDLSLSISTFLLGSVDRLRLRGTWICSFSGFFKLFLMVAVEEISMNKKEIAKIGTKKKEFLEKTSRLKNETVLDQT